MPLPAPNPVVTDCPPRYAPPLAEEAPAGTPWVVTVERSQVRSFMRKIGWIALVCAGIALLFAPHPWHDPKGYITSLLYSFTYFAGLWLANGYAVDYLNQRLSWAERPLRRLLLTVVAQSLASALVLVVVPEFYSVLLWHQKLGYALRHGGLSQAALPLLITVIISLFLHSRSFLLGWTEATTRVERLEKESAVARLDSLRRQVDPHFLFNSLNALTSLVEEEPQRAVRFIRQLSQVYRYVLDSQSQELVPLAEELAFAESYVFLQQTRLDAALVAELPTELPPAAISLYLPPLALQLLLENALKHNTAFQAAPLHLEVTLDATAATLTVRNTLRPRRLPAAEVSGHGLANLRARYAFLTPRPVVAGPAGAEFVVTLPLLAL